MSTTHMRVFADRIEAAADEQGAESRAMYGAEHEGNAGYGNAEGGEG